MNQAIGNKPQSIITDLDIVIGWSKFFRKHKGPPTKNDLMSEIFLPRLFVPNGIFFILFFNNEI